MTVIAQILIDVIIQPLFAIWITLTLHWQRALLYTVLAFISSLLIGLTCLCGQWVATRLLLPIERDIYHIRRIQRAFADEHMTDTRIVIDNHDGGKTLVLIPYPMNVQSRILQDVVLKVKIYFLLISFT